VAGNDDVNAARGRGSPQLLNIVQHVDGESTQSDHLGLSTFLGPLVSMFPAVTGAIRRSPAITSADIAAVDDMRDACEPFLSLRAEQGREYPK
jgi:hypothetical protein